MDFFRPGILPSSVQAHIRSNNTISAKILEQLKTLNENTNSFLAQIYDASFDLSPHEPRSTPVQDIFTNFYFDLHISDSKLSTVPDVSLATLKSYQDRLKKSSTQNETDARMVSIIDEYSMLILVYHLSNHVIYQTVAAKNQLSYWADLKSSNYAKAIYGVQTLPARVYRVAVDAYRKETRLGSVSFKRAVVLFLQSVKHVVSRSLRKLNVNFIMKQSKIAPFKVVFSLFDQEIKENINAVKRQLDEKYHFLGTILNNLPVTSSTMPAILPETPIDVSSLVSSVQDVINNNSLQATAPPGFLARYWPVLLVTINYGPSTTTNIWKSRQEILEWFKHNFLDTVAGFWSNWIVKPISDMLSILRNDNTMTITSKESLKSDLDSLERMITDYARDSHVDVTPAEIHSAVAQGDLTMMMSQYENEIRSPYKSILKGSLIRSILIQVQKTKVDGGLAITGIDKLLKSQQLLFGVLSISPSLFILYQANNALRKDPTLSESLVDRRFDCLKSMNQIEKLVNAEDEEPKLIRDGKLFVEIINLSFLSSKVIPKKLRDEFSHDMNQLALSSSSGADLRGSINRIWNMYSPYFRK